MRELPANVINNVRLASLWNREPGGKPLRLAGRLQYLNAALCIGQSLRCLLHLSPVVFTRRNSESDCDGNDHRDNERKR